MQKKLVFILLLTISISAKSGIPYGYYDAAEGLSGEALQWALHGIIDNHTVKSYSYLWTAFFTTDDRYGNKVWDMYSDIPGGTPPYLYTLGDDQGGSASGEGEGYNINVPLPLGTWGNAYTWTFEQIFPDTVREFRPEMLVVSFGFDTHYSDPVGNMNLQAEDYARITRVILQLGKEVCGGKIAFILEGGYSLLALPLSVGAVISTILNTKIDYFDKVSRPKKIPQSVKDITEEIQKMRRRY